MAECPNDTEFLRAGLDNPTGFGPQQASRMDSAGNPAGDEALHAAREQREREDIYASFDEISRGTQYTAEEPSASDQAAARKAAARMARMKELADEAVSRRNEEFDEAVRMATNTSLGAASWWLNFQNGIYTKFVNIRGGFAKWARLFADQANRPTNENTLWRIFDQTPQKVRALNLLMRDRVASFTQSLEPVARRIGWTGSLEDLARVMGHYAVCRHIPETNDLLLGRWMDEAEDIVSKGPDMNGRDKKRLMELERNIEQLEDFIDETTDLPEDLVSAGYTNGEAQFEMERILRETGLSKEEADTIADGISGLFDMVLEERVKAGVVSREVLDSFPGFEHYVAIRTRESNLLGVSNDSTAYNPGSYYAIQGRSSRPDSAYDTLFFYINRAATEVGSREFAVNMFAVADHLLETGAIDASGIKTYDYASLMRMAHSTNPKQRAIADQLLTGGGIVADVPTPIADGETVIKRRYLRFDPKWSHVESGLTGEMLNNAMSSDYKLGSAGLPVEAAGRFTSLVSQLNTRFSPLFAPLSGSRDVMERASNMVNRAYYAEDGTRIKGSSLAAKVLANTPRTSKALLDIMQGRLDESNPMYKYLDEYRRGGLFQKYIQGQRSPVEESGTISGLPDASSRLEKTIVGYGGPSVARWLRSLGTSKNQVMRVLDGWNDFFQNAGAFAQFVTLREAGVPASRAARGVLEMMNLSHRGELTPYLRVLFPYVVPTVESGVALARTLGLGARTPGDIIKQGMRGYMGLLAAYGAYSMLYPLARESLGRDENGKYRMDAMSLSELVRGIPIGMGSEGDFVRFPVGFGLPQIAAMLSVGQERVASGLMSPQDLAFDTLFLTVKNTMPGNWPDYRFTEHPADYLAAFLCPPPLRPFVDVAINRSYFGQEITRESSQGTTALSSTGRTNTPVIWHNMAKRLNSETGIDFAPEQLRYMAKSILTGPLRMVMGAVEDEALYKGSQSMSEFRDMHPLLRGLGTSTWFGNAGKSSQILYYNAKDEYESRIRRSGVKITSPDRSVDARAYRQAQLEKIGFTPEEISDYMLIWETDKALRKNGMDFNKEYKDRWLAMEDSEELRTAFANLELSSGNLYDAAVSALNYYQTRG